MESAHSDLIQRIQVRYGNLRPAERIVADYLRSNAGTRLDASITEFARILGVSEATISRVSRALGYDGYPSLKLSVAEETNRSLYFTNLPSGLEETDSMVTLSDKFSLTLANSLRETHNMLDADRLERVVQAIANASMTVFIGVGGAASIDRKSVV